MFTKVYFNCSKLGERLQRGYVRDGKILPADQALQEANKKLQKPGLVRLTCEQKRIVEEAVLKEAQRIGQEILELAVCSNHVHLVAGSGLYNP